MSFDLKPQQTRKQENPNFEELFEEAEQHYDEQDTTENKDKILYNWQAPEFEAYEKSTRWYIIATVFILGMVTYALLTDSPIMAITFILIAIIGYIYSQKDPRIITFAITSEGVLADKEMYLYENIFSFWIFYEPNHTKIISLHTKASTFPFVHMPIGDEDPVRLREFLMQNIPELKQEQSLVDTLERVLHI